MSLARCIYSNADVYFLDDPLSAVDAHVGKHIFDHVIGPDGILKDKVNNHLCFYIIDKNVNLNKFKTRVFVTNALSFLPQSNKIIMMENGSIVGQGTYDELINKTGDSFSNYIKTYLDSKDANIEDISKKSFLKNYYTFKTKLIFILNLETIQSQNISR